MLLFFKKFIRQIYAGCNCELRLSYTIRLGVGTIRKFVFLLVTESMQVTNTNPSTYCHAEVETVMVLNRKIQ